MGPLGREVRYREQGGTEETLIQQVPEATACGLQYPCPQKLLKNAVHSPHKTEEGTFFRSIKETICL